MRSNKTARIPVQVEEALKDAFSARLRTLPIKVTVSEAIRHAMAYITLATDQQVLELLEEGKGGTSMILVMDGMFQRARESGLVPADYETGEPSNLTVFMEIQSQGGVVGASMKEEVKQKINDLVQELRKDSKGAKE